MKAAPLLVAWHDENAPIYSAHFEPGGKGRLATAGGDHHVRVRTRHAQVHVANAAY
jgi:chromatin assembly factor 1 subunit B